MGGEIGNGQSRPVRVEIGRSPTAQPALDSLINTNTPGLVGQLFVNGRRVNVNGDSSVNPLPGDTTFVFTYRSR